MKRKQKTFYLLLVISTVIFVCFVTVFYARQLKKTISNNIIGSISEIAEHDKASIQSYIESCWNNLYEINERFNGYDCKTIQDLK
ncbi:MAG: hybrid sensor histidine kinase/response regulator, partial [Lachnospiraceae bacterium]|nr:hybrid sensor histidine kinase/response regulator [Lachnospiraceae bacterium]